MPVGRADIFAVEVVMAGAYRINTPQVVSQVVDGEAVLIHFDSGRYYSADGSGGEILERVEHGQPVAAIVAALAARFAQAPAAVEPVVRAFIQELVDEELIVPTEAGDETKAASMPTAPEAAGSYEPPRLRKYTELQDLLRLDPIHDVDEAGWPIAKS